MSDTDNQKPDRQQINAKHDVNIKGDVIGGDRVEGDQLKAGRDIVFNRALALTAADRCSF